MTSFSGLPIFLDNSVKECSRRIRYILLHRLNQSVLSQPLSLHARNTDRRPLMVEILSYRLTSVEAVSFRECHGEMLVRLEQWDRVRFLGIVYVFDENTS